jgi:LPPG:FO 2-phospho-L-lactate transferase
MRFKVPANVLPASNDPVRTKLLTDDGLLDFQAWFVGQRCKPRVRGVRYVGAESAAAAPGVIEAIHRADAILFAPSNPLLSIEPIMAITPIRDAIRHSSAARIGVSPLINGKAVKGPLAQMLDDIRLPGGASGVAARYKGLLDAFVVDESDCDDRKKIEESGLKTLSADILMRNPSDATRLAREVLNYAVGFAKAPGGGST